jgi:predicted dehydrogenase
VGTGALGRHHVRILAELEEADLVGIVDARPERARELAARHGTRVAASIEELAQEVEAMVVAVPTIDHAAVAVPLLDRRIHVLVEKPIASSLEEADRILASAGDRVLAVGHVEFYNPAVQALTTVDGSPGFVEVQRLAEFTPRSLDVDVVLDLMIHDLQILHALDPTPVREVRAAGVAVLSDRIDIANARVELESGCVANLTASRVSAERVRRLRLFSRESYYSLDYQEQTLKGYRLEAAATVSAGSVAGAATPAETTASSTVSAPNGAGGGAGGRPPSRRIVALDLSVEKAEPLRRELEAFVAACRGESVAYVDGAAGRAALASALAIASAAAGSGARS